MCALRRSVHDVCLIANTKRHSVVETSWNGDAEHLNGMLNVTHSSHNGHIKARSTHTCEVHWPTGLFISEPCRARVLLKECGSWYGGFPFALRGSEQPCTHAAWSRAPSLLARDAMFARYSLSSCVRLSVRSVTSRYCIKTTGRIELVFGMEASFHLFHTVL